MVWFHGGGYTGGGSIQYPGHFLAARDTIVVVVNYRLGVFGFANTPDNVIRGNMGMLDQVLALEFVRDNIANFGGNPLRVTIFGQSAGASSAALHMVSPLSQGLYYQAILESGAENNVWALNYPDQHPENYIYQVAESGNCTTDSTAEMLACLRGLTEGQLQRIDSIECTPGFFCQGFAPIVDGPGGFMPDIPLTLREELGEASVPIIAGHCSDDGSLYTIYFIPEANNGGFTREEFQYLLRTRLVDIFTESINDTENLENAYQAMDWYYSPWPIIDDLEANRQAFNKLITDAAFGYAWDRNAKINSRFRPTYTYIQSFRSLNASSFIPEWMGVPHNGELPYVWGYGQLQDNQAVRDDSEIHFDIVGWTPEDVPYANYVSTLWSNFAAFGDPTPTPVKAPFNDTMTTWPRYTIDDNLKVLDLDGEIRVLENYRQQDYAFFTNYMSYVTNHPVMTNDNTNEVPRKKFQMTSAMFQKEITRTVVEVLTSRFPGQFDELLNEILADRV
jgi:carboxylesterase type B